MENQKHNRLRPYGKKTFKAVAKELEFLVNDAVLDPKETEDELFHKQNPYYHPLIFYDFSSKQSQQKVQVQPDFKFKEEFQKFSDRTVVKILDCLTMADVQSFSLTCKTIAKLFDQAFYWEKIIRKIEGSFYQKPLVIRNTLMAKQFIRSQNYYEQFPYINSLNILATTHNPSIVTLTQNLRDVIEVKSPTVLVDLYKSSSYLRCQNHNLRLSYDPDNCLIYLWITKIVGEKYLHISYVGAYAPNISIKNLKFLTDQFIFVEYEKEDESEETKSGEFDKEKEKNIEAPDDNDDEKQDNKNDDYQDEENEVNLSKSKDNDNGDDLSHSHSEEVLLEFNLYSVKHCVQNIFRSETDLNLDPNSHFIIKQGYQSQEAEINTKQNIEQDQSQDDEAKINNSDKENDQDSQTKDEIYYKIDEDGKEITLLSKQKKFNFVLIKRKVRTGENTLDFLFFEQYSKIYIFFSLLLTNLKFTGEDAFCFSQDGNIENLIIDFHHTSLNQVAFITSRFDVQIRNTEQIMAQFNAQDVTEVKNLNISSEKSTYKFTSYYSFGSNTFQERLVIDYHNSFNTLYVINLSTYTCHTITPLIKNKTNQIRAWQAEEGYVVILTVDNYFNFYDIETRQLIDKWKSSVGTISSMFKPKILFNQTYFSYMDYSANTNSIKLYISSTPWCFNTWFGAHRKAYIEKSMYLNTDKYVNSENAKDFENLFSGSYENSGDFKLERSTLFIPFIEDYNIFFEIESSKRIIKRFHITGEQKNGITQASYKINFDSLEKGQNNRDSYNLRKSIKNPHNQLIENDNHAKFEKYQWQEYNRLHQDECDKYQEEIAKKEEIIQSYETKDFTSKKEKKKAKIEKEILEEEVAEMKENEGKVIFREEDSFSNSKEEMKYRKQLLQHQGTFEMRQERKKIDKEIVQNKERNNKLREKKRDQKYGY